MPGPTSPVVVFFFLLLFIFVTFLLPTTQAQVSHSTPRNQLKKRSKSSSNGGGGGGSDNKSAVRRYIPTYNWEQQEYVKAHNDLREESGVPPLNWHPDLANSSNNWANELRETCDYRHHSKGVYGENIFWGLYKEFTPTDVVKKWFTEKMHFDHTTNLCKCQPETDRCECGHYLNVVWKTSQWVGCSNAVYCKEAKGLIVVCQYDPPGNYKGLDPLNPKFSDDNDEETDPQPSPPSQTAEAQPLDINSNHGGSSKSNNNIHRSGSGQSPTPAAINTSHPPPTPSPSSIKNNHRGSRGHHRQSPASSKNRSSPKSSTGSPATPIVNGSRQSPASSKNNSSHKSSSTGPPATPIVNGSRQSPTTSSKNNSHKSSSSSGSPATPIIANGSRQSPTTSSKNNSHKSSSAGTPATPRESITHPKNHTPRHNKGDLASA